MMTLVTGARGSIGKEVLSGLLEAGQNVRASSRNPQDGEFPDGVEVVRADLTKPESFPALLKGVNKVFLYANAETPESFAGAARDAGVEQIVLLSSHSVLFPHPENNPIAVMHMKVERALQQSGVDWTFVRPGYLATNTLHWNSIRTDRVVRTAFPDGTAYLVHEKDVAQVSVKVHLDPAYRRKALLVPGAGPLTVREQVAAIADAIGEPVLVQQVDVPTYRAELLKQAPESLADRLIQFEGKVPQVPEDVRVDAVPEVLGRPASSYAEWAKEHAEDFR